MLSPLALALPAILLGLLFGSFLNVLIVRLPLGQSIAKPRSHCPHCRTTLRWYDNIPVLSYLLLRGRCRTCRAPISPRYPVVELAAALWFAVLALRLLPLLDVTRPTPVGLASSPPEAILHTVALAVLGLLLIALIVIDWQHQLLPDALTLTGIAIAFLLACVEALFIDPTEAEVHLQGRNPLTSPGATIDRGNLLFTGPEAFLLRWLVAVLAAAAAVALIRALYRLLRRREGMGLGDVKLIAMLAAFLGFWTSMLALFVGVLLATAYAATLLARRRAGTLTRLAFGTFLGLGGLVSALWGPAIVAWYRTLL